VGLFDFLTGKTICPRCGNTNAKKAAGRILCPNRSCSNFDAALARSVDQRANASQRGLSGNFSPRRPIEIRYCDFQGLDRTFTVDADSLVRRKNHMVANAVPTGRKISLSRARIQNLGEVEAALPERFAPDAPQPSARERQVLAYHKKHGSTSPLYEKIRAKYPNW